MKIEENRIFYTLLPIAFVAVVFALNAGSTVFLWFICSFFLFALIDPWMQKFMGKGINPVLLSIALVLTAFAIVGGVGFLVYKTSSGIVIQLLSYKSAIYKFYEHATQVINHWTQSFSNPNDSALSGQSGGGGDMSHAVSGGAASSGAASGTGSAGNIADAINAPARAASAASAASAGAQGSGAADAGASSGLPNKEVSLGVLSGLNSVVSILSFAILTPLLTFFMIAERDLFSKVCTRAMKTAGEGRHLWKKVTDAITAYFLGNLILILVSFPVFVLAFGLLGVKSFVSLGLLSAILNLVPFLGFILAATLPTLDLVMNGGHLGGVIGLIALCCVTHFTIANVVTPKLLGAKLNINATASTIALIAWGELWGPLGLLLAIPLTALIKIWFENSGVSAFEFLAGLMNEDHAANEQLRMTKKKSKATV